MINFTVGPVQSPTEVLEIGGENCPYFRTQEFSEKMFENERLMLKFACAPAESKAIFITGSGTASMEAAVMNCLDENDKALVVNGGSFGSRFVQICDVHHIAHDEITLEKGKTLTKEDLAPFDGKGYSAFLINMHETSTGTLYDMELVGEFCKRNDLFLIVDAISAFLAQDFNMQEVGADIMITGSQKALACPPGISIDVLSPRALERISRIDSGCIYFDFKDALKNAERGQTPFTPAVGTLLQINARLKAIDAAGGLASTVKQISGLAQDFRARIKDLPFELFSNNPANACTALLTPKMSAKEIFLKVKDDYGMWVCPNGGDLAETVFRVGHIGDLSIEDNEKLVRALTEVLG